MKTKNWKRLITAAPIRLMSLKLLFFEIIRNILRLRQRVPHFMFMLTVH